MKAVFDRLNIAEEIFSEFKKISLGTSQNEIAKEKGNNETEC